ncbi:YafY family protein [Bacteroides acidifaciens]|uniref:helix-turn-helix transcriptional regulator n=1 Tax=Bacteroides acidifaciens TaxID=85831 RepID=UPI00261DA8B0|nr:WYL domain-containing protein [Bacteroides acidifaciens]
MVDILLKRYLWLIDTLRNKGEMTYDEIATSWERSAANDDGSSLSKRTLYNHCQAILKHFGIEISCRRGRRLNLYYIVNPDELKGNGLNSWLIENYSLSTLLGENSDIADKIILEDIPSGRLYLAEVLKALMNFQKLKISYRNFSGRGYDDIDVEPLCVKLFKRRWYMLVKLSSNGQFRIFALDRVSKMEITDRHYAYPRGFSAQEFFAPYFGISALTGDTPQQIIFRAYAELPGYLKSLPMHHSQKVISQNDSYTEFSINVAPTFEFIQEILLHRDQIEIISPIDLRNKIRGIINNIQKLYENTI